MSVPPDQIPKGYFHQWTGIPFKVYIYGNGNTYQEINKRLESVKNDEIVQLRLQQSLNTQCQELMAAQLVLLSSQKQNEDDVAQMKMLVKEADETLKKVEFNSPFSTEPRIPSGTDLLKKMVGRIPYIGNVYTGYQIYDYNQQHNEATRVLDIEKDALSDIQGFGKNVTMELNKNQEVSKKVSVELDAHLKILKGLQNTQASLKSSLEKIE